MNTFDGKKRLTRSNDRMLAGVLAGIAEYLDMDPTIVRIIFVLLAVFSAGFPGLLLYIILWIVIPEKPLN
ncbi:PspC domain-containing protein [Mangrovibacterium diazotrophicum]|uniref:Phage shock protein C (PspC) family protein n=1 Tax=Mangrovibacterium diazotrophicum TaxID=1261403 RepID=A0A419W566_9BACT|nr:PspC domain-containing protein [Mangrovibacterium diazotrophicum]RKD90608.1 phage shock protein C (PspC) family protein [Mangrovibacterium diazotrophicum]